MLQCHRLAKSIQCQMAYATAYSLAAVPGIITGKLMIELHGRLLGYGCRPLFFICSSVDSPAHSDVGEHLLNTVSK